MNVGIGCEFSGIVRDAFIARGHNAISCDLLPTERPGPHYQGDVFEFLKLYRLDLFIVHPECTRLCNSGVRWLHERNLWEEMRKAAEFFKACINADVELIGAENPIPHKYALEIIGRKYDQIVQPYQFGHGETKATCLWLKGLPPLKPTNEVGGRVHRIHSEPPGPERKKNRSRSYPGIAQAMAEQWSIK